MIGDYVDLLLRRDMWGGFPLDMRAYFLAQRALCPYCGEIMDPLSSGIRCGGEKWKRRVNRDHIYPKWRRKEGLSDDRVIAHAGCNVEKGCREPHACEVFFCEITNRIVQDIYRAMPTNRPQLRA